MTTLTRLLTAILSRGIRTGRLHLTLPDGSTAVFGPGGAPAVAVRLSDPAFVPRLLRNPDLALGEAYMEGALTVEHDDLPAFLSLVMQNARGPGASGLLATMIDARRALMRLAGANPLARARANVAHHYDLTDALYGLFLDPARQYSCAYWRCEGMTLEEAQAAKMAHIAGKLRLEQGMRVLDIGCGFGGLAVHLARAHGVQVTGITLSQVQLAGAQARAAAEGVQGTEFRLQDYREVTGRFDRVVSVGMLEHVGRRDLRAYFRAVARLLAPGGVALVHSIGRPGRPEPNAAWFQKYIFPGSYCPAVSEVSPAVERAGLALTDLEVWRGHYERTLAAWATRFEAAAGEARAMFDDRFVRMWRFYLRAAEAGFAHGQMVVHQYQLARNVHAVPRTRDYLYR